MNKRIIPLAILLATSAASYAQVGIGTLNPDATTQLEIKASDKGILIPRVELTQSTNPAPITKENGTPAATTDMKNGLLVYNTTERNDVKAGFHYWFVDRWVRVATTADLPTVDNDTKITAFAITGGNLKITVQNGSNPAQEFDLPISNLATALGKNLTSDESIEVTNGDGAVLKNASIKVKTDGITAEHIANGAVGNSELGADAVTSDKIAVGAVESSDIKDGTIVADDLANGAVTPEKILTDATNNGKVLSTDDGVVKWVSTLPVSSLPTNGNGNLTGNTQIAVANGNGALLHDASISINPNSIGADQIGTDAITADELANNAVDTNAIQNDAVTAEKIAENAVGASELANDAVDTNAIQAGAVTNVKIANGAVTPEKILADVTNNGKVLSTDDGVVKWVSTLPVSSLPTNGNGNLTGNTQIAVANGNGALLHDASISINPNSIGADQIGTNAITADELANDAVDTNAIQAGAVTTGKISAQGGTAGQVLLVNNTGDGVTFGNIPATSVTGANLTAGDESIVVTNGNGAVLKNANIKVKADGIKAEHIANGAVGNSELGADAVTSDKIAVGAVESSDIKNGTIVAEDLANNAVTNEKIENGAVTPEKILANVDNNGKILSTDNGEVKWVENPAVVKYTTNITETGGTIAIGSETKKIKRLTASVTINSSEVTSGGTEIGANRAFKISDLGLNSTQIGNALTFRAFGKGESITEFKVVGDYIALTSGNMSKAYPAGTYTVIIEFFE